MDPKSKASAHTCNPAVGELQSVQWQQWGHLSKKGHLMGASRNLSGQAFAPYWRQSYVDRAYARRDGYCTFENQGSPLWFRVTIKGWGNNGWIHVYAFSPSWIPEFVCLIKWKKVKRVMTPRRLSLLGPGISAVLRHGLHWKRSGCCKCLYSQNRSPHRVALRGNTKRQGLAIYLLWQGAGCWCIACE